MRWVKGTLVIFGALIVTALGIDASDTLKGMSGTLLSQVVSKESACPAGMVSVEMVGTVSCVDQYEVSPSDACPNKNPGQMIATTQNLEEKTCQAISKKEVIPWRYITRDQAMNVCARSGKRLPTSAEWYQLSLSMTNVEASCNTDSKDIAFTGMHAECVTSHQIADLVGNAWEWVSDDVIDGIYNSHKLPASGYVAQVDASGVATVSHETAQELFGGDYFWSREDGAYGMIRGGYYDSGSDGGLYTIHADTPPTTASVGIGFRCVK
jgi:formylglycine-generating enzyme required for sulfatase activity